MVTSPCSSVANDLDLTRHPCFGAGAKQLYGRIHLPVAPRCNVQCNFCDRRYDCANESRPGVTSSMLKPQQAADYLDEMLEKHPDISVAGIAGPGDPFANPIETMTTLQLARQRHPNLLLCVASNGLDLAPYVDELAALEVSHVTVTVNTFDPKIGAKIYAWVRNRKTRMSLQGLRGAGLLIERQREAIRLLKEKKIIVKVNTIIMPGINDAHVAELSQELHGMGVDLMNCMPLIPLRGTPLEVVGKPTDELLSQVRSQTGEFIPQMAHCAHCRADAVGKLGNELTGPEKNSLLELYAKKSRENQPRRCIAVATSGGLQVDQALGEAQRFVVFAPDPQAMMGFVFQEIRLAPNPSLGVERWRALADVLYDCKTVLVSAAGVGPRAVMEELGVNVAEMERGPVEEALQALFAGETLPAFMQRIKSGCGGSSCGGNKKRRGGEGCCGC
jgi:nitrogen fixation protein NifB